MTERRGWLLSLMMAFALLALGCQDAATTTPASGDREAAPAIGADSYPTKVGTHYLVEHTDFDQGRKTGGFTEDTQVVRQDGDLAEYETSNNAGRTAQKEKFYVIKRPDAIYLKLTEPAQTKPGQHSLDGGILMLKFPLEKGARWEYTMPQGTKGARRIEGQETLTVSAGTFPTVRIADTRGNQTGTVWYAPGVGVVKSDMTDERGRHLKELTRYEGPR